METGRPSRTLLAPAIRRAAHQLLDTPLILEDPVAVGLVPEAGANAIRAGLAEHQTEESILLRSLFVMRSRFAEDRLAEAAARGVRQYLIGRRRPRHLPVAAARLCARHAHLHGGPRVEPRVDAGEVLGAGIGQARKSHLCAARSRGRPARRAPCGVRILGPTRVLLGARRHAISRTQRGRGAVALCRLARPRQRDRVLLRATRRRPRRCRPRLRGGVGGARRAVRRAVEGAVRRRRAASRC